MTNLYSKIKYKSYKFDKNKLPFCDAMSYRHSMTCKLDCKKLYLYCKKHGLSFFNATAIACIKTLNSIKAYRTVLVGNKAREYEHISPIIQLVDRTNKLVNVFIDDIKQYGSLSKLNTFLNKVKNNPKKCLFNKKKFKDPKHPVAYLTCIPLVDFANYSDIIWQSDFFMPCVHWSKYVNGKMTFVITANHIFVYGKELSLFFTTLQKLFNNPNKI